MIVPARAAVISGLRIFGTSPQPHGRIRIDAVRDDTNPDPMRRSDEVHADQGFPQEASVGVLRSRDKTRRELVNHRTTPEERNRELEGMHIFLTAIIGAMSDLLIVFGPDEQVLEVNNAFVQQSGVDRDRGLGARAIGLFDESEQDALKRDLAVLRPGAAVEPADRCLHGLRSSLMQCQSCDAENRVPAS